MRADVEARNAYAREYYTANKERDRGRRRAFHRLRMQARKLVLNAYKLGAGCLDCSTREGRLDFDHRDDEVKLFKLAQAGVRSWESLWAEVAKCDVRCAACHARRHA